jgi:hypothetical protein
LKPFSIFTVSISKKNGQNPDQVGLKTTEMKIQLSKYAESFPKSNRKTGKIYENENAKIYSINVGVFSRFLVLTVLKVMK